MAAAVTQLTARLNSLVNVGIHYGKVAIEFGSLVAKNGNVGLPSGAAIAEAQTGFGKLFATAQNGAWKKVTVREAGQVVGAGVTVYGFFLVGEMIGRGSLVGYKIPGAAATGGHH
ncbi:hypothetical protein BCR33DRAFT_719038 [Rhizoclosmatium globosum]|uniref:Uncharacterized protein n=1 Tax=Rhizoclosmatium globosum TaxID=329046 RepID=A0A1Y2B9Q8_9FUNG|nr:hypothetical protein HDU79_002739 [Rhizoclosmatium sp. JEL0117]ORY31494.1 hypothetical protein BCR33DRAFT_723844 [Rhizoclosmatium globosum]ORY40919.1 hypothetical protein BCR33DRAFT_719038 [Rhizoclosmatium globosum]|eukprot:ORY31494.1 hypothetical protein BCR33DRAFT_723844 [Rhizoclosmatium globosum]